MKKSLGFALVGCGDIAQRNATSLNEASGTNLVRVVDIDTTAAENTAHTFGVPASNSLEEALQDEAVEAVFISVPHDLHCPMIETAARAGRHIIVEKPIATRIEDATNALEVCRQNNVELSVCHPRSYEPKVEHAQQLIGDGIIGELLTTTSSFLKVKKDSYWNNAPWRGELERSGGGIFLMNLIHHLDALQVITKQKIRMVNSVQATRVTDVEVEDTVAAILEFEGGAIGTVSGSSAAPGPTVITDTFIGSEGRIELTKRSVRVVSQSSPYHVKEWTEHEHAQDSVSKTRFIEEFSKSIRNGMPVPIPAAYGIDLARLVLESR
ncbi:MAG: Gfo/Idh/MocA family oxidoreductase [Planctomycetota bacterium]